MSVNGLNINLGMKHKFEKYLKESQAVFAATGPTLANRWTIYPN